MCTILEMNGAFIEHERDMPWNCHEHLCTINGARFENGIQVSEQYLKKKTGKLLWHFHETEWKLAGK